jgi:hypothetical protein
VWHRIFAHLSRDAVKQLADKNMVTRMKISPSSSPAEQCTTCIQAKQHVESFPKQARREYTEIGDMTFTDVWGPSRTRGIRGEHYFITFTDGAKRYRKIVTMKKKSEAEQHVMDYTEFILTQTGKRCKAFRFDGGGEYLAKSLWDLLATKGIQIEPTAP